MNFMVLLFKPHSSSNISSRNHVFICTDGSHCDFTIIGNALEKIQYIMDCFNFDLQYLIVILQKPSYRVIFGIICNYSGRDYAIYLHYIPDVKSRMLNSNQLFFQRNICSSFCSLTSSLLLMNALSKDLQRNFLLNFTAVVFQVIYNYKLTHYLYFLFSV